VKSEVNKINVRYLITQTICYTDMHILAIDLFITVGFIQRLLTSLEQ